MSDLRKLLESMHEFSGEPEQKPGDQVRGTDKAKKTDKHPFLKRLVGEAQATAHERDLKKQFAMFKEYQMPVQRRVREQQMAAPAPTTAPAGTPGQMAPLGQPTNPAAMAQMKSQQLKQITDQKKQLQDQITQTTDQLTALRKQLADVSNPANIAMNEKNYRH
jgi:uncharacterized protein (DUF2252 family)